MSPGEVQELRMLCQSGALAIFFRRYLLDCLNRENRSNETPDDLKTTPDHCLDTPQPADAFQLLEQQCQQSEAQIRLSARTFIARLPDWADLYLRYHECSNEDQKIALHTLARRYGIASYHYKAQRLGISIPRDNYDPAAYRDTDLGQWLLSIGVLPLNADDSQGRLAFQAALAILCQEMLRDGTDNPDLRDTSHD